MSIEELRARLRAWKLDSEIGIVCGVLGCKESPKIPCPRGCNNHYCVEHAKTHVHQEDVQEILPDLSNDDDTQTF
jgi:hypothetical protein